MIVVVAWLIAVPGVLIILWVIFAIIYLRIREALLIRSLKARRRAMEWKAVQDRLKVGEGTLIIQTTNKIGLRMWWTPDDLISAIPRPILEFEGLGIGFISGKSTDPFIPWCAANYLSVKTGKAYLTQPEKQELDPWSLLRGEMHDRFPQAKIVYTLI